MHGKVPDAAAFRLQLFISGATPHSSLAIANITAIGENRLKGNYFLEVIDAFQQSGLARDQQVVVLPTLIKQSPLPRRRLVGDLSNKQRVLLGLGLSPDESDASPPQSVRRPTRTARQDVSIDRQELAELRARLDESESMLRAIRSGEVDALVIDKASGEQLFIQEGAEQPYREMVETMSEGAVTITPEGTVLYCNQRFADMARVSLRTIMGCGLLAHFATENVPELTTAFRDSFTEVQRLRATLLASDAALVPVNVAMRGQTKNGTRSIAIVVSDLTRWREAEEARGAAEQANKAKTRFLTMITHELRTPLHGILGYAELLSLEGNLEPTQAKRVSAMIAAGEHLLGLINAVLDVSQIEAGRLELHPIEVELVDICRACLDVVRSRAEEKELVLILKAVEPLWFFGDPTRLRQILLNLLGNATKFTPSGTVELRVDRLEGEAGIRLEVADTGPGIWARHRDKLFQTFERLNADAVSGIEGAGLGLSLAARLVRAMKGQIGYQDNPGGGSVFWVELPASRADFVTGDVPELSRGPATRSVRVLVVDDDALNRDIVCRFLTLAGHEAVSVDNGADGVEVAKTQDFDLVLMDVRMPGMNGLEATRRIRMLPAPRGAVPVIALTAQAFGEQIELCLKAGMNTHLSKPFKRSVLLAAVERVALESGGVTPIPPADAQAGALQGNSVFDRAMFLDSTELLSPEAVRGHLETLIARGTALQRDLRAADLLAPAGDLAEAAHRLAGGAAILGFIPVATLARCFEASAAAGGPELAGLGDELAAAIDGAITILQRELAER